MFLFQRLATKKLNPKFDFEADADVAHGLKSGSLKARRHPGSFSIGPVSLPEPLIQAAEAVVKGLCGGNQMEVVCGTS